MSYKNMFIHMFKEYEWSTKPRWFKGYGKFFPEEDLYQKKRMKNGMDFSVQGIFEFDDEKIEKYLAKLFLHWKNDNWILKKIIVYDYIINYMHYPYERIKTYKKIKPLLVIGI